MKKEKYVMTINTERLFIEPLLEKDASFIFELLNTESWIKYIGNRNINSELEAADYIQKINDSTNANIYWVVILKEANVKIGLITLIKRDYLDFQDIGFAFLPAFFNKGYAYEATNAVLLNLTANNSIKTILGIVLPENVSSVKLLEKLGLKFEGEIEQDDEKLYLYARRE